METLNIPKGYQQIMPYLVIKNASAFFGFTKNVFDAEERMKIMRTETVIMHAEISINGSCVMFADANEQFPVQNAGLFIYVTDCDSVYKKALMNGAVSLSEPADQEYGRSSGVKDEFGNTWWITSA